ncbi:hypothetical protein FBZ85_12521 [Azospirillum brasilense]|nr:hypothetical protein [Azospirillum baldaniorum]TWA53819.1 hypothetical protein FBZ84_1317 [Azospirillum baldaniorum]TWA70298.1 hypothetical protein FBZ85_12521 [Azospirillum brasilense]
MLGFQRSVMSAFIHLFGEWLLAHSNRRLFEHPGAVLFPKTIHELDPSEPKCPDGAGVDYVLLALAKGEAPRLAQTAHPFERMLQIVQRETQSALAIERLLLARLEGKDQ